MHHVKPIADLTDGEVRELAVCAAERGERIEDVNPFTGSTHARLHALFEKAFREREADLQPAG